MMPNRSLCWMYSSYLSSVSSHTPRGTPVLPPPRFHLSFLLSHLINLLSFLFFLPSLLPLSALHFLFIVLSTLHLSTSPAHRLAYTLTLALTHFAVLQRLHTSHKVPKWQKKTQNGNKSPKQQPTTFPVFSKEPPQRNTPIMSTINCFFLLKIQSFSFGECVHVTPAKSLFLSFLSLVIWNIFLLFILKILKVMTCLCKRRGCEDIMLMEH